MEVWKLLIEAVLVLEELSGCLGSVIHLVIQCTLNKLLYVPGTVQGWGIVIYRKTTAHAQEELVVYKENVNYFRKIFNILNGSNRALDYANPEG